MDVLDIIILVLFVLSLVRGVRLGAAMQVLSFGGFWAGLIIGALIAPSVAGLFSNPVARLVAVLVVVFGCAGLVGTVGRQLGMRAYGFIRRVHLGPPDAAIGAVVAGVATLLVAWAVAGMVKDVPAPQLDRQISDSAVLRQLNDALPPSPQFFSRIEQLLNTHGFPQVFAGLTPTSAGPVRAAGPASVQEAVANAGHSTVKIVSQGCGEILEGSGFLVAPGLYVTNAHVVAGTYSTQLEFQNDTPVKARIVYFDPNFDLALLRAPELPGLGAPLRLDGSDVSRGQVAAVLGYPGGGNFNAQPAGVRQLFLAQGRNIYGTGLTSRYVYELQAVVRPGNSGGPLVEPSGLVIGVVFSTSATNPDIGYALASPSVVSRVQANASDTTPVSTGACAQ
ncbi:MAG: MarP family serine protease [Acidimicrobiales bacterium]